MKAFTRLFLLLLCGMIASCASKKHAVTSTTAQSGETTIAVTPSQDNTQPAKPQKKDEACITSRLRLDLSSGSKSASVGGTLRMKKDDVIQLSLVTFGILEVARIEMTPDYFMLINKMERQYVKAAYSDVPFLSRGNVDFRFIQAFFWNEQTPPIAAWERKDFVSLEGWNLPTKHLITISSGGKTGRANITLRDLRADEGWVTRTPIPANYTEVPVDKLMSRILNLSF